MTVFGAEALDTTECGPVKAREVWCVACEATGKLKGEECPHCEGRKKVKVAVSSRKF